MSFFLILLYSAKLVFCQANANILSQTYDRLSFQEATGPYADSHYLSVHSVYPASFTSTGDQAGHSIEFAFHNDGNYWVSKEPNTNDFHNNITVTFPENTVLEAFLYLTSYKTTDDNARHYCGFPTKIKVYTALNDNDDFVLSTIFIGIPTYPLHNAQYVFKNPIECKRLKFEFIDVTEDIIFSDGSTKVNIGYLNFIKHLNYSDLEYDLPSGDYSNSVYTNFHRIPDSQFDYISSGQYSDYKIENAFDNTDNTFWIADTVSDGSSNSHIIINFKKPTLFEGFLLKGHHHNNYVFPAFKDFYPGVPTKLELYVSQKDNDFVLNSKFGGYPKSKKDTYQFILSEKVLCDKIMIKFIEAVNDNYNKFSSSTRVIIDQLILLQGFENEGLISQGVNGNYANPDYLSTHTVSNADIKLTATGGSQEGHDITTDVALDGKDDTYWVSKEPNTGTFHNSVKVDFNHSILLEAVLIDPVYKTVKGIRTFSGFPTRLNIYSSLNDDEFKLVSTFIGMPDDSTTRVQFVLPNVVNCTKLLLEFVEVTPFVFDSDGSPYAGAAGFVFIQKSDYDIITYHENTGYAESRIIPKSKFRTFWSTGDTESGPVSNLFDDDDSDNSYWESSFKSDDSRRASVFVNFTEPLQIDELLLGAYKGFSKNYGFPTKLNVYISNDDHEELKLVATFQGSPGSSRIYQFTFREPVSCSRIQLEFIESYDPYISDTPACLNFLKFVGEIFDFSSGDLQDYFVTQYVNKTYPLPGLNDTTLIINDLPSDNDYLFVVERQFYFDNVSFNCPDGSISAIKSNHSNNLIVRKCKFSNCNVKSSIGSGGAILSLNCDLKCDDSHFTDCNSKENGGGGGIFVVLNENTKHEVTIENCNFTHCSASFGGAIYLYSNDLSSKIIVQKCSFNSNQLIESTSKNSMIGGSAIYMNAQCVFIKRCKFAQNAGESSIKVDPNFDNVPSNFLNELSSKSSSIEIDHCEFEISLNAKSSISYVQSSKNHDVKTVVSNCVFNGQLLNEAHHIMINSNQILNQKSKLSIQSCRFACDKRKSINLNLDDLSNSLVVFNLDNQFDNKDEEVAVLSKKLFIAAISIFAVAAVIATIAVVIISKRKSEDIGNNNIRDPLNHQLDNNDL